MHRRLVISENYGDKLAHRRPFHPATRSSLTRTWPHVPYVGSSLRNVFPSLCLRVRVLNVPPPADCVIQLGPDSFTFPIEQQIIPERSVPLLDDKMIRVPHAL